MSSCSGIQFYVLLSPYLCFIYFLYLDLNVFGVDALISYGSFLQTKHLSDRYLNMLLSFGDNCTQNEANKLEKIQHEAARIVSGATKLVSIEKLSKEGGWDTPSCQRKKT